jgi:hypothetical protein
LLMSAMRLLADTLAKDVVTSESHVRGVAFEFAKCVNEFACIP